jgi:RNA polymerase sigma-70 factor (ECF subfamily)
MMPSGATALGKGSTVVSSTRDSRLQALAVENFQFIWRSLRRLGVPPDMVDDATQQVFVIASRRIADIEAGRERAFLFMTAVRVASEARRARARSAGSADARDVEEIVDSALLPDELATQHEERKLLDTVLGALPEKLRTVFLLFELEEMSSVEIAQLLGVPVGTVASRLRLARGHFHKSAERARSALGDER